MMGSGGNFDFGAMMNGGWSGGWPILLLGALVVVAIVLAIVWAMRTSRKP
jgi:uncharacterized membrane protein